MIAEISEKSELQELPDGQRLSARRAAFCIKLRVYCLKTCNPVLNFPVYMSERPYHTAVRDGKN